MEDTVRGVGVHQVHEQRDQVGGVDQRIAVVRLSEFATAPALAAQRRRAAAKLAHPLPGPQLVSSPALRVVGRGLLDLRLQDQSQPDRQGQEEPDRSGHTEVSPLLRGQGTVEQRGLGEVEVDPGLQVPERWVPAELVALGALPVVAGSLRLVGLSGGAEVMPWDSRYTESPPTSRSPHRQRHRRDERSEFTSAGPHCRGSLDPSHPGSPRSSHRDPGLFSGGRLRSMSSANAARGPGSA